MRNAVTFFETVAAQVETAMRETDLETVVFGIAGRISDPRYTGLVIRDVVVTPEEGYLERSPGHFRLDPVYVADLALSVAQKGGTLALMHSHPGADHPPDFSEQDRRMHSRLVPSLLGILDGPVASLVWSRGGWNGRIWLDPAAEQRLDLVKIVGSQLRIERTGSGATQESPAHDRQVRAFGARAQQRLRQLRVGVVGLGGTGSPMAQGLAHLGVRDFVVVDPDRLEETNLSRVVGSQPGDVRVEPPVSKVTSAARMITTIAPDAWVESFEQTVVDARSLAALRTCDVVFLCTDGHASRAVVGPLAVQYGIPVVDLGTLLRGAAGEVVGAYADVRMVRPDGGCLRCQGVIDPARVMDEMLPAEERRLLGRFGYAPGLRMPAPSVLPLNTLAVALAQLRLLDLIQPWLEWDDRTTLETRTLTLRSTASVPDPDCEICGPASLIRGRADDASIATGITLGGRGDRSYADSEPGVEVGGGIAA